MPPLTLRRLWTAIAVLAGSVAGPVLAQTSAADGAPVIGIGNRHSLTSTALGETVDLVVQLPADYSAGEGSYPVLLVLGSDYREKFALAAATVSVMSGQGQLPSMIVVGVDLPHGNFVLVPQQDVAVANVEGHLKALADEIAPYIERRFRTNGYSILYGGSNSGLFTVWALLRHRRGPGPMASPRTPSPDRWGFLQRRRLSRPRELGRRSGDEAVP